MESHVLLLFPVAPPWISGICARFFRPFPIPKGLQNKAALGALLVPCEQATQNLKKLELILGGGGRDDQSNEKRAPG